GIVSTPKFRLDLHVAISMTLESTIRGAAPTPSNINLDSRTRFDPEGVMQIDGWSVAFHDGPVSKAAFNQAMSNSREAMKGLAKPGKRGNENLSLLLETVVVIARQQGCDLRLP